MYTKNISYNRKQYFCLFTKVISYFRKSISNLTKKKVFRNINLYICSSYFVIAGLLFRKYGIVGSFIRKTDLVFLLKAFFRKSTQFFQTFIDKSFDHISHDRKSQIFFSVLYRGHKVTCVKVKKKVFHMTAIVLCIFCIVVSNIYVIVITQFRLVRQVTRSSLILYKITNTLYCFHSRPKGNMYKSYFLYCNDIFPI